MLGLEKTGKRSLSWGCWLGSSTTALRALLESPWAFCRGETANSICVGVAGWRVVLLRKCQINTVPHQQRWYPLPTAPTPLPPPRARLMFERGIMVTINSAELPLPKRLQGTHLKAVWMRLTVGRCDPMLLRRSTSAVPIGGSRLFRPRGIGEGEESVSAVTGLQSPPAKQRCKSKVVTTQANQWEVQSLSR